MTNDFSNFHALTHTCMHVYIYTYREREMGASKDLHTCMHVCTHTLQSQNSQLLFKHFVVMAVVVLAVKIYALLPSFLPSSLVFFLLLTFKLTINIGYFKYEIEIITEKKKKS